MGHPAPAKYENAATMHHREITVKNDISCILHLPGGQRFIGYSWDGSFRVLDLERDTQVGEEWEDKDFGVDACIALSPGSKTLATGSLDGTVKLWNIDTGKVMKTLMGHTKVVKSVCWSSDGGRVVSGSWDKTFRVWNVESGKTDAKVIATGGLHWIKVWDANTGELLKTLQGCCTCLAWTSNGKILIAGRVSMIATFDTATWTILDGFTHITTTISLSPNERILASTSYYHKTALLWNLETKQLIGTLYHEHYVKSATFSADGKFLVTGCNDGHIHMWDLSIIVRETGLLSHIADATPRPKDACRIPQGFFDNAIREANLRTRISQSHGAHNRPIPAPRQHTFSPLSSFWYRSKPHKATEPDTRSRALSWPRNLVSGMMRRRDTSKREPPVVKVPYTAGKPRNYHARKKPAARSSRPHKIHTTQQHSATTQGPPSSSQLPHPTATTSTLSAVADTDGASGTILRPHITGAGWRARFVGWICCIPILNAYGHTEHELQSEKQRSMSQQ